MKKKYVAIIFPFLVLLLLAAAWMISGYIIKRNYEQTLSLLSKSIKIDLQLINYQQFFFYSQATIATNYPLTDKPLNSKNINPENALIIIQHIYPGPIIFRHDQGAVPLKFARAYIESYLDPRHRLANTILAFDGSIATTLALDEFSFFKGRQTLYTLKNLTGELKVNSNNTQFFGNITLEKLTANLDNPREILDFKTTYHLNKNPQGIWSGSHLGHFGSLTWQQDHTNFSFNQFDYAINSLLDDKGYQAKIECFIQSAKVNQVDYGPQNIALILANLDTKQVKTLQRMSPPTTPLAATQLQQNLLLLLNKGFNIQINKMLLNTAWGQININAQFSGLKLNRFHNFFSLLATTSIIAQGQMPILLASNLLSHYHLVNLDHLDISLAQKNAAEALTQWQNMGWLTQTGDYFLIHLQKLAP